MYQTTSNHPISIILTQEHFQKATLLQSLSKSKEIGKQKYLNTLAVYAVNYYLGCLDIETDLENSDLFKTSFFDFDQANLQLLDLGIDVECRPVLPEDKTCILPPETWDECLGYFAVEIDEVNKRAMILGFYPAANPDEMLEEISIEDFLSLDYFFDYKEKIYSSFQELVYIIKQVIQDRDVLVQVLNQENKRNLLDCCLQSRFAEEEDVVTEIINRNLELDEIKETKLVAMSPNTRNSSAEQIYQSFRIEDIGGDFFEYIQDIWQGFDTKNNHDIEGNSRIQDDKTIRKWSLIDRLKQETSQAIDRVNTKLDELAEQVGWLLVDNKLSANAKPIRHDPKKETPNKYFKQLLTIAGEQYELRIKPIDLDRNIWTFELRSAEATGMIPPGFKFRLLGENGEELEDNERVAEEGQKALLFEIELEEGEGIIWEIEPIPDNYQREIICF